MIKGEVSSEERPQEGSPMKLHLLIYLAVVSLLLSVIPAVSQVNETKWTADIPFDFIVGDNHSRLDTT